MSFGKMIAIEGPLFSGKTTVVDQLPDLIKNSVIIKFPFDRRFYGTPAWQPCVELCDIKVLERYSSILIASAMMLEKTEKEINSYLLKGKIVVLAGWINAAIATLCYPFGKSGNFIMHLCEDIGVLLPHITIILSTPFEELDKRYSTLLPNYTTEIKDSLIHSYNYYQSHCPGLIVDANKNPREVAKDVVKIIQYDEDL